MRDGLLLTEVVAGARVVVLLEGGVQPGVDAHLKHGDGQIRAKGVDLSISNTNIKLGSAFSRGCEYCDRETINNAVWSGRVSRVSSL